MFSTEQFTRANKDWGELDVGQRTWKNWKNTYRAASKKVNDKKIKPPGEKTNWEMIIAQSNNLR